jgi:short-subunit dehydrogenase
MSVYYASKAYVLFFSQALEKEVRSKGVTVTTLCPGPTKTGFQKTAQIEKTFLGRFYLMDSASVAKAGYEGLMKGKSLVIPGFLNKLTAQSNRVFPRKWITQVTHVLQSKKS